MKHFFKFTVILPILLMVGFGMMSAGGETVSFVGKIIVTAVVPGLMFIGVAVGLILMITGKGSDATDSENVEEQPSPDETESDIKEDSEDAADGAESAVKEQPTGEREKEYDAIEDVNSSYGYESKLKSGMYVANHAANNYKNSSKKEKILGWLFFGFLMTSFGLILVFAFLQMFVGALVCAGIFAGTILLAILITVIGQKMSMGKRARRKNNSLVLCGEVKNCLLSSTSSTGGGRRHSTTRITKVIYKVTVYAGGRDYVGYSDCFFETGETVTFVAHGSRAADILTPEMLRKREEELLNKIKNEK